MYAARFENDGQCLVISFSRFWCDTFRLRLINLPVILTTSSEGAGLSSIPVALASEYTEKESRITSAVASVRSTMGDDSIKFECNYSELYKSIPGFGFEAVCQYVEYFAKCVAKYCADDMIKEAVVEAWTDKKFTLVYTDMTGLKYASGDMNSKYNGVRFVDGHMEILVHTGCWWTNTWYLENSDFSILL